MMYAAPKIEELGTVAAFTLGSSAGGTHTGTAGYTKANNSNADFFTAFTLPGDKGSPCSTPLGQDCSTPGVIPH